MTAQKSEKTNFFTVVLIAYIIVGLAIVSRALTLYPSFFLCCVFVVLVVCMLFDPYMPSYRGKIILLALAAFFAEVVSYYVPSGPSGVLHVAFCLIAAFILFLWKSS